MPRHLKRQRPKMQVFEHPEYRDHEQVLFCRDRAADLSAIIAIHSSVLGPAAGGCRMLPYESLNAAVTDVLRLSYAMTVKNALAGLPLGGGKSVIIADPADSNKDARLAAFAKHIEGLGGQYWTAEDVGVGVDSVELLARHTGYVFGRESGDGRSGDPAPHTALGVLHGMRAAVRHASGHEDFSRLTVAVQGIGHVGFELCRLLHARGCTLVIADRNRQAIERARQAFAAVPVDPSEILFQPVDVLAPCALGGVLTHENLGDIRAKVIAGSANNQLAEPSVGSALQARGMTFVPDFVLGAGGVLHASSDIFGQFDAQRAAKNIQGIYDTTLEILEQADKAHSDPSSVAEDLALRRIDEALKGRAKRVDC